MALRIISQQISATLSMGAVTFTFSEPVVSGLDQTGRAYVVDPGSGVTVTAISPAQTTSGGNIINGAQKNFAIGESQGLDQRMDRWSLAQNDTGSISLVAGDTLIKVISNTTGTVGDRDGNIDQFACLHCVTAAPTATQVLGPTLTWSGDATPEVYDFDLDAFYAARTAYSAANITWQDFATLKGRVGQFWPTYAALNTDIATGYESMSPRGFGRDASLVNGNYGIYMAQSLGDMMLVTTVAAGAQFTEQQIKDAILITLMHGIEMGIPLAYVGAQSELDNGGGHAQFYQGPSLFALHALGLSDRIDEFLTNNGGNYRQAFQITSLADFAPHTSGTLPWFTRQRTLSTQPGGSIITLPFNIPAGYGGAGFDIRRDGGMPVGSRIVRVSDGVTAVTAEAFTVPDVQGNPIFGNVSLTAANPFTSGNVVFILPPTSEPLQIGSYDWTGRGTGGVSGTSNYSPYFGNNYKELQSWGGSILSLIAHGVSDPLLDVAQGYYETATLDDYPSATNDYLPVQTSAALQWKTENWNPVWSVLTAPAAFVAGNWTLNSGGNVSISTLPNNGGSIINGIDYRLNGGSWTAATGITEFSVVNGATVSFTIPAYSGQNVEIRASNAIGDSAPSDVKAA